MKLIEIANPVDPKDPAKDNELPIFMRRQAGPVLKRREKKDIAYHARHGRLPSLAKRQAE